MFERIWNAKLAQIDEVKSDNTLDEAYGTFVKVMMVNKR